MKTFTEWASDREREFNGNAIERMAYELLDVADKLWSSYSEKPSRPDVYSPANINRIIAKMRKAIALKNDDLLAQIEATIKKELKDLKWKLEFKQADGAETALAYDSGGGKRIIRTANSMT